MRPRITFGRFLISLGSSIKSLAVVVMKPDDLVEFSRCSYAEPPSIDAFSQEELINSGLSGDEKNLLEKITFTSGRVLILGLGSGREVIPLARMGFEVTGVDFVPQLTEMAKNICLKRGVNIEVQVQEISKLDFPPCSFDLVWLSSGMYSSVPGRKRRVEMLKKISSILKPGGFFLLQYYGEAERKRSACKEFFKKLTAVLSYGNIHYEPGDTLWANKEFVHVFSSEEQIRSEFAESGLTTTYLDPPGEKLRGGALLEKK